ncbi:3-deoxy-manno-octulosonate cytidylyltransferase [Chryseolinea sp. H1M3-3]|uniref:3-deoxy-manno-octulosonate cytidylyltransferase n=1 Tax=Chryseolinea sp. H1M3-3 TaxID=3034144 RepID=UPI0023EBC740|nr:3-deoxy-manno-octulosonate cytidylyltransferase [Chryseolinea sp. H1M3-3]
MKIIGIIPSRYASTRFPAKSLAVINGKSMIQRVYEQVQQSSALNDVVVATDHREIYEHVKKFGGEVCLTKPDHVSGTDRCYEALTLQQKKYDYVINIQGDEPFIQPDQIDLLAGKLDGTTEIATLVKSLHNEEQLFNPNVVKVVVTKSMDAMYFSRSPIPHIRNTPEEKWITNHKFYKHIGMYAYRSDVLERITRLSVSSLETAESLEQLRWLEHGFKISVAETDTETMGIDTPEDLQKAIQGLR